ncbi:jg26268 [Pararge aegeria aegeria]|uniref:Jg26268 protein n=1 Tax=Pararge aegeria aegeria TaxID=348720 RepID=A0A8S4QI97_9NEOP|nr:jg26268 [Pararge aegeria aegeria]
MRPHLAGAGRSGARAGASSKRRIGYWQPPAATRRSREPPPVFDRRALPSQSGAFKATHYPVAAQSTSAPRVDTVTSHGNREM